MRRLVALLWIAALGCSSVQVVTSPGGSPTPTPTPSTSRTSEASPDTPSFPGYRERLPRRPAAVSALLVDIYRRLPKEIDRWIERGGRLSRQESDEVHRGALAQQRVFRLLAH